MLSERWNLLLICFPVSIQLCFDSDTLHLVIAELHWLTPLPMHERLRKVHEDWSREKLAVVARRWNQISVQEVLLCPLRSGADSTHIAPHSTSLKDNALATSVAAEQSCC